MHHTTAVFASLSSLGLICMIYYCNILSPKGSWLRSEIVAMILLSLLTVMFPLAVAASLFGLFKVAFGGMSFAAIFAAGADLLAVGAIVVAGYAFRVLVKATYSTRPAPKPVVTPEPTPIGTPVDQLAVTPA